MDAAPVESQTNTPVVAEGVAPTQTENVDPQAKVLEALTDAKIFKEMSEDELAPILVKMRETLKEHHALREFKEQQERIEHEKNQKILEALMANADTTVGSLRAIIGDAKAQQLLESQRAIVAQNPNPDSMNHVNNINESFSAIMAHSEAIRRESERTKQQYDELQQYLNLRKEQVGFAKDFSSVFSSGSRSSQMPSYHVPPSRLQFGQDSTESSAKRESEPAETPETQAPEQERKRRNLMAESFGF